MTTATKVSFPERLEAFVEEQQSFDFKDLENAFGRAISTREKLICTSILRKRRDIQTVYQVHPITGIGSMKFVRTSN